MNDDRFFPTPFWRLDDPDWHLIVGNKSVAVIVPNHDRNFPHINWLSAVWDRDPPDYGWHAVDFETLEMAKHDIEQWWFHAIRGEVYRP